MNGNAKCRRYGVLAATVLLWAAQGQAAQDSVAEDCQRGNGLACSVYAISLERAGRQDEAREWLTKACNLSLGAGCLALGSEELSRLNDDAAARWYDKACDLKEAEGCYAMSTYWSARMRKAAAGDAERGRCADKGLAYADKALALKPGFVRALLRKQLFWDERATLGDPAHSDEAFAKVRALKAEREELTRRQRAANDPDLLLGLQHDFESRPPRKKAP